MKSYRFNSEHYVDSLVQPRCHQTNDDCWLYPLLPKIIQRKFIHGDHPFNFPRLKNLWN